MGLVFTLKLFLHGCVHLEGCAKDFCCTRLYAVRERKLSFEGCLRFETRNAICLSCNSLPLRGSVFISEWGQFKVFEHLRHAAESSTAGKYTCLHLMTLN